MVASALLIAIASLFAFAQADAPYPTAPVKSVYRSGSTCHIKWLKGSSTWQGMNIELMTGSNTNMISLATVASGQDGSRDGSFDHPCPEVTVNAPIYFYRFTSKGQTPNYTARFTIASSSGHTDPAPNPTQPDGEPTPWGVGAIKSGNTSSPSTGTSTIPVPPQGTTTTGSRSKTIVITPTGTPPSGSPTTTPTGVPPSGSPTTPTGTPAGSPTTVVIPTTRTITYLTTKTRGHDGQERTRVQTETIVVTDKLTSIVSPTPTVTVTTTMWIKPTPTTTVYSVSTALKFTTSYVQVTVTPRVSSVTTTVSSVSTVTASPTASGANNRSGQKSSASRRADFPIMHILAFVVGSAATCLTLLS